MQETTETAAQMIERKLSLQSLTGVAIGFTPLELCKQDLPVRYF